MASLHTVCRDKLSIVRTFDKMPVAYHKVNDERRLYLSEILQRKTTSKQWKDSKQAPDAWTSITTSLCHVTEVGNRLSPENTDFSKGKERECSIPFFF
ncbi:hypothetical protein Nmel_002638 [Mimus melanotis]